MLTLKAVMGLHFDVLSTLLLLIVFGAAALAYSVRTAFKGRAQFDRVDKQGGSALLSKSLMEMAYWTLQPLGRALVACHITPNQISYLSLILGLLAGVALGFGHFGTAAVLSTFSAFLDALDGMVARLSGLSSDAGEVLDATIDRYNEFFFLAGLTVYYRDIPALQILALAALVGSFMVSYSTAKAEAMNVSPPKGSMRRPERALYLTLGAALSPITIPMFEQNRDFSIAVGHPMVMALCLVALLSNVSAIERMYAVAKEMRKRENEAKRAALMAQAAEEQSDAVQSRDHAHANSSVRK